MRRFRKRWTLRRARLSALASVSMLLACNALSKPSHASTPAPDNASTTPPPGFAGGAGSVATPSTLGIPFVPAPVDLGASCDPSRSVASDGRSLLVRDPEVLARFSLERVLAQIIATAKNPNGLAPPPTIEPLELLQRLFDTENISASGVFPDAVHCDDSDNSAFVGRLADGCPRAEGALAKSTELLTAGAGDYFAPVALVQRFDLMPNDHASCGEYRIVYAKQSGLDDPDARAFLILEAALTAPARTLAACRPVAEFLADLESTDDITSLADRLERFFFQGLDGFTPVVDASHYGLGAGNCEYSGKCGQLRLAQGMQAPWEFRQFRLSSPFVLAPDKTPTPLFFAPTTVSNSLVPELFDPKSNRDRGPGFRADFLALDVDALSAPEIVRVREVARTEYEAGSSALDGPAQPNYAARTMQNLEGLAFVEQITEQISKPLGQRSMTALPAACPVDDPLDAPAILARATAVSCAGCHAPDHLLANGRKVGCGQVWPASLGQTHIDEHGALSPALREVFLPYRARVLRTYLQACDADAIDKNLQPVAERVEIECFAAGTPITMADGSERAIEQIVPGEVVLAFDETTRALVPGHVEGRIVRPDAERLIVINGALEATGNHPFYTARGQKRAEALELGDALIALDASELETPVPSEVRQLAMRPSSGATYNLEIAVHHNYFAGGLLVRDKP